VVVATPRSRSADSILNVHLDVLGLLQFGLTPTLEMGKQISGYVSVTPLNTGLASYFLIPRGSHDELQWGLAGTAGMHVFSARDGNMRGLFGGGALQYAFVRTIDKVQDRAVYGTHVLIPQLDLGYRWAFERFLLGLGGKAGLSIPVAYYDHPYGAGGCAWGACNGDRSLWFLAGIFLDLGWFF
jgi:hypothetical protein